MLSAIDRIKKNQQKILVTGGFGYIGSRLIEELKKSDIKYISIDKLNLQAPGNLCLDLRDKNTISSIKDFSPDIIIHCGTHSALAYHNNFIDSFREDFEALINTLDALRIIPQCRLIFFSSSYVYSGLQTGSHVTENNLLAPKHNFGIAKYFFEEFILRNHPNCVIFRLSSVFGPGNSLHPNVILSLTKECLEKGKITVWGYGNRKMQFILIDDVIDYILEAIHFESGVYNLGGNDYVSVAEAAKAIADFFRVKIIFLKNKQEGDTIPFMSTDKLKNAAKKDIFTPFPESLKNYLNYIGGKKKI